jgi:hypothetical protein
MLWVGVQPAIPTSEQAKTVHALDRSATVTGDIPFYWVQIQVNQETGMQQTPSTRLQGLVSQKI